MSRGLALVKWWLLAIPQYLIIGIFGGISGGGLITLLAVIAGFFRLFGKPYPREIHNFVVGMNRWVYRVIAYALLMRDEYPPFRLEP